MNWKLRYQWKQELARHLSGLNGWQIENVALFSYGIIRAESCQQGQVARQVSCCERVESVTRRWRRFLSNRAFPLGVFFAQWTSWVVQAIGSTRITLLVDETKLHDRMGVMMVGLAWQKRSIPLAWRAYRANDAASYPAEGQVKMIETLLETIKRGLPSHIQVLVLADRGIGTSPDLCRAVAGLGWSYLFRVTCQSKIITPTGEYTIAQQGQVGEIWYASGKVFKKRGQIPAHARAIWSDGYDEPWVLVTNDEHLTGYEYARRNWQEQSFRDLKSGGWQWGQSRVRIGAHVERLLVLLVVAYGWLVAIGSQAVAVQVAQPLHRPPAAPPRRQWSLFREGLRYFTEFVQRQTVCLGLVFIPDLRCT